MGRLRSPERIARLEIGRIINESVTGIEATTLLDLGAGSGLFAGAFAARGLHVTGIDVEPRMIQVARRSFPTLDFCISSAEALPFPRDSFDMVFLGYVFHEVERRLEVLREAGRVAKKRVTILESAYQKSDGGPATAHRVKPEALNAMALAVGFQPTVTVELGEMALYKLGVG